ncbi:MAG: alpha-L-arabinofuranosidase, partial [Planctomycetota bacterium]
AARKTVEFATKMRKSDSSIQLIGWGDFGRNNQPWASRMLEVAGEHLQFLAFHHMFNPDDPREPVLGQLNYRKDPDRTWAKLMDAVHIHDRKIRKIRDSLSGNDFPLAMTECHFTINDRDRCDVLSSWTAGVAYARMLNLHQRHGDLLTVATAADFCGNRWQVNAVMIPTPPGRGNAFLMPVARVMSLYRRHIGQNFLDVKATPDGLDVTASRTKNRVFLHVVNTLRTKSVAAKVELSGLSPKSVDAFEIAADPGFEITRFQPRGLDPVAKRLPLGQAWEFPPASVTAVEIECEQT